MNKYKKIATAVVATVMAGTMVLSFTACDSGSTNNNGIKPVGEVTASQKLLDVSTDADGNLKYSANTTLKFDVGDNAYRNVAYTGEMISGSVVLPDGNTYSSGDLKPAWKAMSSKLNFKLTSTFGAKSDKYKYYSGTSAGIAQVDLFTDTSANIVNAGLNNTDTFLDLSLYLDYMPNFKQFLADNPATYMSLTASTSTGAIYYAPYYDGNNDIEKYVLAKTNWITALLDNTTGGSSTTLKAQAEAKSLTLTASKVESYMGKTGSYKVDTTSNDGKSVTKLVVNYDAALTAAKDSTTPLGQALANAGVTNSSLTSGNIVDLQNAAINAKQGEVTGAQLLAITQAYIDVAYQKEDGTKFYTKRSDVFNGYDAGWDVDLLVALYRCTVTNNTLLKSGSSGGTVGNGGTALNMVYGLSARQNNMQRQADLLSIAGTLYGVRGLESRYEYSYIDANGKLQDARANAESYEIMDKMNKLVQEGLVYVGSSVTANKTSYYTGTSVECLSLYDYVNTQTPAGFQLDGVASGYAIEDGYYFTPIVGAISNWDVDGNGEHETVMRFTESWRSVKNSGFAVPYDAMKDSEKLAAMLAFIDYLYSDDGQIAMTYGPMATDSNGTGGFWYNEEATDAQIKAGTYFEYEGKKYYSETFYAGSYQPTLTEKTLKAYYGDTVNGVSFNGDEHWLSAVSCVRSYTNFARYVVGSALALGNKLQSFEYQATCTMGKYGAAIVDTALNNGTFKHVYTTVDECDGNLWYLISPTTVPLTTAESTYISNNADTLNNEAFTLSSSYTTNYYFNIMTNGLGNSTQVSNISCGATGAACVTNVSALNLGTYLTYKQNGFARLKTYFGI